MLKLLEQVKPSMQVGEVFLTQAEASETLTKMGPDDDPEAFLETFEQVFGIYQ